MLLVVPASLLADQQNKCSGSYQHRNQIPTTSETTQCRSTVGFDPAPFCAAPRPNQKRSLSIAVSPSSALLCGSMLTTAVNFPTRRASSPQIRARDTSLDDAANGSAGINGAPDVDARIDGATHLGGRRRGGSG